MRKVIFGLAALFMCLAAPAFATCSGQTATISLLEGGSAVHITGVNATTCAALPPASLSVIPASSGGCSAAFIGTVGSPGTKVSITTDATGLNFTPVAGATGMASCAITLEYTDGGIVLGYNIALQLTSGVTSIVATSP